MAGVAPAEQPDRTAVHREALAAADRAGKVAAVIDATEALADALADEGAYDRAAVLLGGAEAMRADTGTGEGGTAPLVGDRARAVAEEALGEVRLAERLAEGRRLSYAEVVALAVGTD
ncbi:MAG: hypothetical protein QOE35_2410 [Actinomycetota bacterium]